MGGDALTPDLLRPILAPFDAAEAGLAIFVEDPDGRQIAAAGVAADGGATVEAAEEIRCGPGKAAIGRVVGRGAGPLVQPIVASVAASLAALAGTTHEHAPGGDAAHRLESELALGRRIQRSLIPLTAPAFRGYDIASHYEAAREVGGDFFDVFRLRDDGSQAAFVMADVTGKGIAAALLMAFARPLMRSAIDHLGEPALALERLNRILVDERRSALFITALAATLDLASGALRLANAGHEPPIVIPGDGRPSYWLTASGPLLGAFPTLALAECEVRLEPRDVVVLYTDGVTDTRGASGERFGDDRLVSTLEGVRGGSAQEAVDAVVAATRAFQGDMPPADDVAIVAVRREA